MTTKPLLLARASQWLLALSLMAMVTACDNDEFDFDSDSDDQANAFTAQTQQGPVQGVEQESMLAFRGIPYAAPPVGDLRFAPPQPVEPRSGVLDASTFATACPQPPGVFSNENIDEDCLYLNVYRPKADGPYPVMVWIHGGSLETGSGDVYNPAPLVAEDVIVVTINYRLGILGFLAHPALSAASEAGASGNYGLMDQQAALEWVQANIANFGGNPDNVTIFGESAGGRSVLSHLVRPPAEGLFDKAIVQSGSLRTEATLAQAEAEGATFGSRNDIGCLSDSDPSCLRGLTVEEILAAQAAASPDFVPNRRPEAFPNTVAAALHTGGFNQVSVIVGTNLNEYRLFVGLPLAVGAEPLQAENYQAAIQTTLGVSAATAQTIAEEYPLSAYDSPDYALSAVGTDAIYACDGYIEARSLSQHVQTWAYEFADQNAPPIVPEPENFDYGAAHAFEIQYVFGPTMPGGDRGFTADQLQLAETMTDYWTQFAKTGNPNSESGTSTFWPAYASSQEYLQLVPPTPQLITDFAVEHRCAFWASLM